MKRYLTLLLTLALLLVATACTAAPIATEPPVPPALPEQVEPAVAELSTPPEPFPGRIAIITNTVTGGGEEYYAAQRVVAKYGADKILHKIWPDNFMAEQEQMIKLVIQVASEPGIKALVINQAVPGTVAALEKMRGIRDDIFVICCTPQEDPEYITEVADLVLAMDELAMGSAMVQQAYQMGAKTFVHYSFPRHLAQPLLSARRDLAREECEKLGIKFVDATSPDPTSDAGIPGAQQFILVDVPKMVIRYGQDTAFFSTNCAMQVPLIKSVVEQGAIYPQPCCPSPWHGFPLALELTSDYGDSPDDMNAVVAKTTAALEEKGAIGRLSTWPIPVSYLSINAGAEYAVKWLNGEVTKEGIDVATLEQCMAEYAGVDCSTLAFVDEDGTEYPNYLLILEGYLTYGQDGASKKISTEADNQATNIVSPYIDGFWIKEGVLLGYDGRNTNVVIPAEVTSIGSWAFWGCDNVQAITIPKGVSAIERHALAGCTSLKSIKIPAAVSSIGAGAFSDCSNLKSITIPTGIASIESSTFSGCSSLKAISIPEGVTKIGSSAFSDCSSLESITIPEGVTEIGSSAFYGCTSLKSISIPESVTEIGWGVFGWGEITIHCTANSAAEVYAQQNRIPCVVQ